MIWRKTMGSTKGKEQNNKSKNQDKAKIIKERNAEWVEIGQKLKTLRTRARKSRKQVAIELNIGESTVYSIENGDRNPNYILEAYKEHRNFFGERLYEEILGDCSNIHGIFSKKGTSKLPCFLYRTDEQGAEFKSLFDKITKNKVTIVCADGGVGKTTLVKQFLCEYENYKCENKVNYYQTIAINSALQGEGFDLIKSFLSADDLLTTSGEEAFYKHCKDTKIERPTTEDRQKWIKGELNDNKFSGLFVLDNLTRVTGKQITELETEFPNCKFVITTRRVTGVAGVDIDADIVLNLETFGKEQALKLFKSYYKKALSKEDEKIFDEQINSWCCGNAEAICYVAKIFSSSSVLKLSDYREIERDLELKFDTGLKKDLTGESSLAKKLSALLPIDEALKNWLEGKGDAKNTGVFNVLSILSLTEMQEIPVQSLVDFLCKNQERKAKFDFEKEIIKLEHKGLIKYNETMCCVKMHPLICKTLELNGIEKRYTDLEDLRFFVALITDNESLTYNLVDKIKVLNRKTLKIPKGIKKIRRFISLYDDFDYEEIDFRDSTVEIVGESAFERWNFQGKLRLMEQLDEALGLLFWNKYSKKVLINFSDSITEIGESAFAGNQMENLSLPKNLKKIGNSSFYGCCNIERITIPDSVTEMGKWAFADCSLLKEVTLPNQLEIINKFVFKRCCSLKEITIPDNVKKISAGAFSGCRSLKEINFGNGVVEIGEGAFYENDSLNSIKFPKSLKQIGSSAFCNCYHLKEIDLCNVEKICEGAFWGCKSLTSIKIPSTVKVIEEDAFYGCPLEKITVEEGCLYKEKGGELYNAKNEIIFSVSDKPNLKTEEEWFLAQGDLKKALYDDTGKYLPLINNNGESVIFTRVFVCDIEKETYCILFEWEFLKGRGRHVYKLCEHNGKFCFKKEWDFNTCVEIFWRYNESTKYTKE